MTYRVAKWLILFLPTLTMGGWEYVRHRFLLPYLSMAVGNWLSPAIVFLVSVIFLTRLFRLIETMQEQLNRAKAAEAVMEERVKIARELHDGVAQTLFLLSVKVDRLQKLEPAKAETIESIRKTVFQANEYVRQAIANLRFPSVPASRPWMESLQRLISDEQRDSGLHISLQWAIPEQVLSAKEKVELYAAIREAVLNVRKHAEAEHVRILGAETAAGWVCSVSDDGKGFDGDPTGKEGRYGLAILRERAAAMGWQLRIGREKDRTVVEFRKGRVE